MSIYSSLFIGASGLRVNEAALGIIGDNIANMNTVGYKTHRGVFADILHQTVLGQAGPSEVGQGAALESVERMHLQGALLGTGVTTDIAIGGDGLFILKGDPTAPDQALYTRNGQFHVDAEGFLASASGLKVQGYMADSTGTLGTQLTDLFIGPAVSPPAATTQVTINASLDPNAEGLGGVAFDPANPTGDFTQSITIYDSLGNAHSVDVYFDRDPATGTWSWHALANPAEVDGGDPLVAEGTLEFNTDGQLVEDLTTTSNTVTFTGATPREIAFDFGESITEGGDGTDTEIWSPSGQSPPNGVHFVDQDGYGAGHLQFFAVGSDGLVNGHYSNGEELTLGQLALAEFESPSGLKSMGGNLFAQTQASGDPTVGAPSAAGRGELFSGALEQSTVDLTTEFTQMILAQRGFQASSRTIITADSMLTEVIGLKR